MKGVWTSQFNRDPDVQDKTGWARGHKLTERAATHDRPSFEKLAISRRPSYLNSGRARRDVLAQGRPPLRRRRDTWRPSKQMQAFGSASVVTHAAFLVFHPRPELTAKSKRRSQRMEIDIPSAWRIWRKAPHVRAAKNAAIAPSRRAAFCVGCSRPCAPSTTRVVDAAVLLGNDLNLPVLVYQAAREDYLHASDRLHSFIFGASRNLGRVCAEVGFASVQFVSSASASSIPEHSRLRKGIRGRSIARPCIQLNPRVR
jgi:hypothetical protein